MMIQAVLMVCAIGSSDCNPSTALQLTAGPAVSSLALCEFQAQVLRAQNRGDRVIAACFAVSTVTMRTDAFTPIAQPSEDALAAVN